jgi:sugar phosphate isomerase/epimerase
VRDAMTADAIGTLKTLAALGYTDVECAGYAEGKFYGMSVSDFKKTLSDLGLKMNSGHTLTGNHKKEQTRTMINNWEAACDDFANVGMKSIVLAYLFDFERKTMDDYKKIIDLINNSAEVAQKYGLQMAYHNHDFEFKSLEGKIPYDVMLAQTDKNLVKYELDLYWVTKAEKDAITYFKNNPGRFPFWHVKDMENSSEKFFTEVGNGVINWKEIFSHAKTSGMQRFYVEQDVCKNHKPLESAKISIDYLKTNII